MVLPAACCQLDGFAISGSIDKIENEDTILMF